MFKTINVREVPENVLFYEIIDRLLAQATNIHGLSRGKVNNCPPSLGRAKNATATPRYRLAVRSYHMRAAFRVNKRWLPFLCTSGTTLFYHLYYFRHPISSPALLNGVPISNILVHYLYFVVHGDVR